MSENRSIQLGFQCNSCGLAGLTPEVTRQEALHLACAELEISCPTCGSILSILTSELEIRTRGRAATFARTVRDELEQVLTQELLELVKKRGDD